MLEASHLTKRYGAFAAVSDLSFSLERGERFGLLGPNGAGKTTTISMLVGAVKPDSGAVLLDAKPLGGETDPRRRKLGYVPQEIALHEDLAALDNLRFFGALYGLHGPALQKRIDACLEMVGLSDRARSRVAEFSGGMKRRLNLAAALLHEPELLILDEPTVGVDPQSRNAIFENLETLMAGGITLLYTTHYMEEVERLCDRIAIVDRGKLVAMGTLAELRGTLPEGAVRLTVALEGAPELSETTLATLSRMTGSPVAAIEGGVAAELADVGRETAALLAALDAQNLRVRSLKTDQPGLEDVFLHLTGKSLRDQ